MTAIIIMTEKVSRACNKDDTVKYIMAHFFNHCLVLKIVQCIQSSEECVPKHSFYMNLCNDKSSLTNICHCSLLTKYCNCLFFCLFFEKQMEPLMNSFRKFKKLYILKCFVAYYTIQIVHTVAVIRIFVVAYISIIQSVQEHFFSTQGECSF